MADRQALHVSLTDDWKIIAAGPRRNKSGDVEADLILENGKPVHQSRAIINSVDGRKSWAMEATSDSRPSASDIEAALLLFLPRILETLQESNQPSQADGLVNIVNVLSNDSEGGVDLWHDTQGEPWATIVIDDHREHWPLLSRSFKRWLARLYYEQHDKAPGSQAVTDAINVLAGSAVFEGDEHQVFTRIAQLDEFVYLDLGDESWRSVEIRPDGWDITDAAPVRFRRPPGMQPLPEPVAGFDIDTLFDYLNVADDDHVLIEALATYYFSPIGPYPVLVLMGEQGSAKSTFARIMRSIVDPNISAIRAEPKDVRDLVISATNGAVVVLDNVSRLKPWMSDAICRVSTGGGVSTRALFTDDEEQIFDVQRPVIITAIEDVAVRGDLLDRAIVVTLPSIPEQDRKTERQFWAEFENDLPGILGALLDRASRMLRDVDSIELDQLPRMADFARAASASLPDDESRQSFIDRYAENRATANETVVESSLIAGAVLDHMANEEEWLGTYHDLLDELSSAAGEKAQKAKEWPKTPRGLSSKLRSLAPNLKFAGVAIDFDPEPEREAGTGRMNVRLVKVGTRSSQRSQNSQTAEDPDSNGENACEDCGQDCEHCECRVDSDDQHSQETFTEESASESGSEPECERCEHSEPQLYKCPFCLDHYPKDKFVDGACLDCFAAGVFDDETKGPITE